MFFAGDLQEAFCCGQRWSLSRKGPLDGGNPYSQRVLGIGPFLLVYSLYFMN